MKSATKTPPPSAGRLLAVLLATVCVVPAQAGRHPDLPDHEITPVDGIHVIDGSYVIDAGLLQVNITNHGLIGSHYTDFLPYSSAPSAQWPGGTGDEYLYGAGLWIGARKNGTISVTTGQPRRELRPTEHILDTIYEAVRHQVTRPTPAQVPAGYGLPHGSADDDQDGALDEDMLNGRDDDGDGRVDEDFAQIGDQMMVAVMSDDTRLVQELYPDHQPLGVKVIQRAAAWSDDDYDDFVAFDFEIRNEGHTPLEDLYLGFYVDCDIQRRSELATQPDDQAGFFDGVVRDTSGLYYRLQVAYMYDANPVDPLPGYFGVTVLDHTTDFSGLRAPVRVGVTTFRSFTTGASVIQGGEPTIDADRYAMMAGTKFDRNTHDNEADDYRMLVASGPFPHVRQGAVLDYRLALVVGDGLDAMLRNAARAAFAQRGAWYDADHDPYTGTGGHETYMCLDDLPQVYGAKPIEQYRRRIMDETCTGSEPRMGYPTIEFDDGVNVGPDGRTCFWVNADNCEECFRYFGRECTTRNDLYWVMPRGGWGQDPQTGHMTGWAGREHRAPWTVVGLLPPRPPDFRVQPGDGRVELFWDDVSEHIPDVETGAYDFEAYRVWRITDWRRPHGVDEHQTPPDALWGMIAEWDLVNHTPAHAGENSVTLEFGRNTGLEGIRYEPTCLGDPRFEGVAEVMEQVVADDPEGRLLELPPLRRPDGTPRAGLEALLPWEGEKAVLDTFFAVTPRAADPGAGVVGKRGTRYYHWVDEEVHNNIRTYYAVTALDHTCRWWAGRFVPTGIGTESPPAANFLATSARQDAQTPAERARMGTNIYVYPNPVTPESLAEFDQQATTWDNPTGAQIVWANLPAARNTIRVYTTSGDLVKILHHDGTGGDGTVSWNLVSRNRQDISSGIYLYVVQSDDGRFEDFVGRFVVIR